MATFLDIHPDLCHNCGTCVAVCPQKALSAGLNRPTLAGSCNECGTCYDLCPGVAVDFNALNRFLYPAQVPDIYFGCYKEMFLGRGLGDFLTSGSSGGIVTALLSAAMEKGLIEASVVVDMDPSTPYRARVRTASSVEQIRGASGSKYSLVPVNSILSRTSELAAPVAYVGLPCHLHGLRKLQAAGHPLVANISYTIGLFCGFNLLPDATLFLLRKMGVPPAEVERVCYRAGEWPGSFLVEASGGRREQFPKLAFNFLHLLYLPRRCALCPDLFAETADISVGDYWPASDAEKARSSIIVRNERGGELLLNARDAGAVELLPLSPADLYRSHAHLVKYKKRSFFVRMKLAHPAPSLAIKKPHLFPAEYVSAMIFFALLRIGDLKVTRLLARLLPLGLLGKAARAARRSSASSKRRPSKRYWTLAEVGEHWDHVDEYDALNIKTYSYGRRFIDGYRMAAAHIPENAEVLDISCRTGRGSLYFGSRKKIRLTGMAPSPMQIQKAREGLEQAGVPFRALEWTGMRLPFPDETFDFIMSFETIEHVFQWEDFLSELYRILKRGGALLLTTPNLLWDPLHTLAPILRLHHGEGPHRFLRRRELLHGLRRQGFVVREEVSAVLFAYGPAWLTKLGAKIERRLPEVARRWLCLRRIILCGKGDFM